MTKEMGGGMNCVLAMRTIRFPARLMPPGIEAMDIALRNCVMGSPEVALAPFASEHMSGNARSPIANGATQPRMLSPLAAPLAHSWARS
jgi:hypothetical protein